MPEALIVSAVRTGVGKFLGSLKDIPATDLGAHMVRESVARAREILGWSPERSLETMIADAWAWHSAHPDGY